MTSYGLLIRESAQTRLARTQTRKVRPDRFSSICPAERGRRSSACFAPHTAEGTKAGGSLTPLCPVTTKQRSSCRVWRTPAAEGPTAQEPATPISPQIPWCGRDCQIPARELREQQRLAACISLVTLGGQQQPMPLTHWAEVHSCISQAFGTLAIPKKMTKLRQKRCICSAWP